MTSSNGNIFRITGPLWGESTRDRWIPLTKASDTEHWCFLLSVPEQTVEQTNETPVIRDTITLIITPLYCFWVCAACLPHMMHVCSNFSTCTWTCIELHIWQLQFCVILCKGQEYDERLLNWWALFSPLFFRKVIHIFASILPLQNGTVNWNSSSWTTMIRLSCKVNTMAADGLATQGARASLAMVLTTFRRNIPVPAPQGLTLCSLYLITVKMSVQYPPNTRRY